MKLLLCLEIAGGYVGQQVKGRGAGSSIKASSRSKGKMVVGKLLEDLKLARLSNCLCYLCWFSFCFCYYMEFMARVLLVPLPWGLNLELKRMSLHPHLNPDDPHITGQLIIRQRSALARHFAPPAVVSSVLVYPVKAVPASPPC